MTDRSFDWARTLGALAAGESLSRETANAAMARVMAGDATPAQIASLVTGLRAKGETSDEITGMVEAMLDAAVTVDAGDDVVDIVGTGGDKSGTFNISTTAAFIAAGAGAKVAKHGNRAASSKTGSADILEALGIDIELSPEATVEMIRTVGFGFFFAPRYHPAMRHAGPVRREIGFRTVFNILGPLCNPARAKRYAMGVADPQLAGKMIEVLRNTGAETAFVFHGEDGLDELTTTAPSIIYRLIDGEITHAEFTPEDFGIPRAVHGELLGGDVDENKAITLGILEGTPGPKRDIALINAAPAIVAAGLADGFTEGMDLAIQALDAGDALAVLERAVAFSGSA
ncbi:MAG TPA: anthranilate phosphoribosyltransferase [Acidimicrobiia bacterium]|nr:anthranilate phosphoribosyltransferase [Acidimicrobiia bacterium]